MNDQRLTTWPVWLAAMGIVVPLFAALPARAERLRGVVLNKSGEAVGGARVWAVKRYERGLLPRRQTHTDNSGRFMLEVEPGEWKVWACHDGWAGETVRHDIPTVMPRRDAGPISIWLRERGLIRGRLIEQETGRPIAGGRFVIDNAMELTANELGRFEFAGISPHCHEAYVVAPGRECRRILFDMTLRPMADLELKIPPGGRIIGRVTSEQGKPIPGAYVGCVATGLSLSDHNVSAAAPWDRCDPDGRYTWDGNEFGRPSRLVAGAPGYLQQWRTDLVLKAGSQPLEVNFRLKPAPVTERQQTREMSRRGKLLRDVAGIVTLPDGGHAANAIVRWGPLKHWESVETQADGEGRFRLIGVPDQYGTLAVIAPSGTGGAPAFPRVERGGGRNIAVKLEPGETCQGRVLDDAGAPLEGVSIVPTVSSNDPRLDHRAWLNERSATSDTQGRFSLRGLPNADVTFDFRREGLVELENQPLKLGGGENTVVMQYPGMIRGRVVDRAGRPVRNFRILVNLPNDRRPNDLYSPCFAGFCGIGISFTSAEGVFVISELGVGSLHRISVVANGYAEGVVDRVASADLSHLPPADALTIPLGPAHHLRIRVVQPGAEFRGVRDARVTLVNSELSYDRELGWSDHEDWWEDFTRGRTDEQGWAEFPALAYGGATVLIRASGFARRRLGWRDGCGELVVPLQSEAVVTGEVRDAAGASLTNAYVGIIRSSGESFGEPLGQGGQGRFRLAELPEGEYTFTIAPSFSSPRVHFGPSLHGEAVLLYKEQITLRTGQVLKRTIQLSMENEERARREGWRPDSR